MANEVPVDLRLMYYVCLDVLEKVARVKDPDGFKRYRLWQRYCRISGLEVSRKNIRDAILRNILASEGRWLI